MTILAQNRKTTAVLVIAALGGAIIATAQPERDDCDSPPPSRP